MVLKRGELIRVRAFGGKEIVRRFFAKQNGTVLICSDEEYQTARLEKRQPICVGFPVSDVIASEIKPKALTTRKPAKERVKRFTARRNYHA